jgi:hypothetical protein
MRRLETTFVLGMQPIEIEHGAPASPAPACLVQDNAGEPRSQTGGPAEIAHAGECPDKGILHGVLGFLVVSECATRNAV